MIPVLKFNTEAKQIFKRQFPDIEEIFEKVICGRLDSYSGKQHLWHLWFGVDNSDFHNNRFTSTDMTYSYMHEVLQKVKNIDDCDKQCLYSRSDSTSQDIRSQKSKHDKLLDIDYLVAFVSYYYHY